MSAVSVETNVVSDTNNHHTCYWWMKTLHR